VDISNTFYNVKNPLKMSKEKYCFTIHSRPQWI
jgi:hypothetical protein